MATRKIKKVEVEELPSNSEASRMAPIRESRHVEEGGVAQVKEPRIPRTKRASRAIKQKKTFIQSIAETLVGNGENSVVGYIWNEILLPSAKSTLKDMVTSGIEHILYGESSGGRRRERGFGKTIINYTNFSQRAQRDRDERRDSRRLGSYRGDRFGLNEIFFEGDEGHEDAEDVLMELCDRIKEYETVSVADYFDLAGLEGATFAHYKWGWDDLSRAFCTHKRQGWAIVLPDPIELE